MRLFLLVLLVFSPFEEIFPQSSFPYFSSSNGLLIATYNSTHAVVEGVWPHLFANIDSSRFVHPFVGNIQLKTAQKPIETVYKNHSHIIEVRYPDFTVHYLAPFSRSEKVFYVQLSGQKQTVQDIHIKWEAGAGKPQSGIEHLSNPFVDLPEHYAGDLLLDSLFFEDKKGNYLKYYLFSFNDALHSNNHVLSKALKFLQKNKANMAEQELDDMLAFRKTCKLPPGISANEQQVLEQSISMLRMAQVGEAEIFPKSRGQVLASLRPGLWHVAWVRDAAFAIQAMTRLGMYDAARKALTFMLQADAGRFKHYHFSDGKDYGPGVDYRISLTRYFGNGTEECDFNEWGPNIEYDDWGLFLTAYSDYVLRSGDMGFARTWQKTVETGVADAIIAITAPNGLIRADSGPWEHHLKNTKQYAFTSGVCARGLQLFASLEQKTGGNAAKCQHGADILIEGLFKNLAVNGRYFKSNAQESDPAAPEFHDAGSLEIFAGGLLPDAKARFFEHLAEYDPVLRIQGPVPGYIRMRSDDIYENQEWVFIDLRMVSALNRYGAQKRARKMLDRITELAVQNGGQLPEMLTYRNLWKKPVSEYVENEVWCYCIRDQNAQYAGAVPMVGYGAGAYVLALSDVLENAGK